MQHGDNTRDCQYQCDAIGDLVLLRVDGLNRISNVSISVYQHLECPVEMYGPGCELRCNCTTRQNCHKIKGLMVITWVSDALEREPAVEPQTSSMVVSPSSCVRQTVSELISTPGNWRTAIVLFWNSR